MDEMDEMEDGWMDEGEGFDGETDVGFEDEGEEFDEVTGDEADLDEAEGDEEAGEEEAGEGDEEGDEETEEETETATEPFEWEGRQYDVPVELMPALEAAQAVETQRQDVLQAQEQLQRSLSDSGDYLRQVGWSMVLEERLKGYQELDWQAHYRADPQQAQMDRWEYDQLRDEQRQLNEAINQRTQAREAEHAQAVATQLEAGARALKRAIPNWTPAQGQAIRQFACKQYGYEPHELSQVTDHRFVQAMRDAKLYREQVRAGEGKAGVKKAGGNGGGQGRRASSGGGKRSASSQGKGRGQRYRPLKSAQGRGRRQPASASMSTADWIKAREAQLRNKQKRAQRRGGD
ncbi:MAG: hypothetical protein KME41_03655 [Candidatus Thiodiazotropha sp. (ex Lucina pensylvanica)]|nr:hypothetical protein [Candidatus Thiodiazotropha sp. (ex Lucina pensylvanica)]MBT3033273.1 hypothetical protein [Candidatus Thiodiazotropha sp. (ex Lucina pensylvanica)]